jgi:hypothetical protein
LEIRLLNEPKQKAFYQPWKERRGQKIEQKALNVSVQYFELWANGGLFTFGISGIFAVNAS